MQRSPDQELAVCAARHHGVFTAVHARLIGLTRDQAAHRVVTGRWEWVHDDVYRLAGVPESWEGALLAACWAGGFRAVASHRSAAALWGLAGGRRSIAEISCPRWRRARHDRVVVHETNAIDPIDCAFVDAIPVTTVERTLLDLGAVCHESVVELALDAAERRELVTIASVRAALDRLARPGRNGVGTLRALLDRGSPRRAVPESDMETMLLQVLRRGGLPEPLTQHEIRQGRVFVARVDAAYPEARLAIEYDSYQEHAGRLALVRDVERRNRLIAAGWTPISATAVDLQSGGLALCATIRSALERAS